MQLDFSARATLLGTRETRTITFTDGEIRTTATNDGLNFRGYASITEAPYEMNDWAGSYVETMKRGAFKDTLAMGCDTPLVINHEGTPLARTKSGTLQLSEDGKGLLCEARLDPASPIVQSVRSALDRGDLNEMSLAFRAVTQGWSDDYSERDLHAVNLNKGDVSIVTNGANPFTSASMRSLQLRSGLQTAGITRPLLFIALQELREGKTLSNDSMSVLQQVLDLIATADEAVDDAQPLLASLMGVPNPDENLSTDTDAEDGNGSDEPADAPTTDERALDLARAKYRFRGLVLPPVEKRGAIAFASTPTSDAPWDAGEQETHLNNSDGAKVYRQAYAWVDPKADPDTKSAYKFIHHFVDGAGAVQSASTAACSAGIAVLDGARTGTTIPDADRQGVWEHLAGHLKDAGKHAPVLGPA